MITYETAIKAYWNIYTELYEKCKSQDDLDALNKKFAPIQEYIKLSHIRENTNQTIQKDIARYLEITPKPEYRPLHDEPYNLYNKLSKVDEEQKMNTQEDLKFKAGQQVETPLGVGTIYTIQTIKDQVTYKVEFEKTMLNFLASFVEEELEPYKTPHEKLLDIGFGIYNGEHNIRIISDSGDCILINKKSKQIDSLGKPLTFDLWKLSAEYLEWLEKQK